MKKVALLLITVAMLLSCSKDNKNDDQDKVKDKDKNELNENCSIIGLKGKYTDVNITYDENGKVSKIVDNSEGADYLATYELEYAANKISVKRNRTVAEKPIKDNVDYIIDKSGKLTSSSDGWNMKYNQEGYLIEIKNEELTDQFTYANDNLVFMKTTIDKNTYTNTLEYDINEKYVPFTTNSESLADMCIKVLYEQGYLGKKSKNRIKYLTNGSNVSNYSYEKDAKGKTVKVSTIGKDETQNLFFEYHCK